MEPFEKNIQQILEESKINDDFNTNGIQLLKRSRKGLLSMLFSRTGVIILLLLLQIALVVLWIVSLRDYMPHYMVVMGALDAIMALVVINSPMDSTAKITWIVIISVLPIFGALFYLYCQMDTGHRKLKRKAEEITEKEKELIAQDPDVLRQVQEESPETAGIAHYIQRTGCYPIYSNTDVRYFALGEDMLETMLWELDKAEDFIFLEYFIINEGIMWGKILEILARKAREGVDVRVIYDGTCEITKLPSDYPRRLEKLGIQCRVFSPLRPFISTHYNYRDHRKIMVIDGKTAFTGGVNLADEYINEIDRFGKWKDTALMIAAYVLSAFLAICGIYQIFVYLHSPVMRKIVESRLASGLILLLSGTMLVFNPAFLQEIFPVIWGLSLLAGAFLKIQYAFDQLQLKIARWWIMLIFASLSLVIGILAMLRPDFLGENKEFVIGLMLIFEAVLDIVVLFMMNRAIKKNFNTPHSTELNEKNPAENEPAEEKPAVPAGTEQPVEVQNTEPDSGMAEDNKPEGIQDTACTDEKPEK